MPTTAPTTTATPTAGAVTANAPTSNAPATQIFGSDTVTNANTANPTVTPTSSSSSSQTAPTVASNVTKQNDVGNIKNNTATLNNTTGLTQNASGQTVNSNGTLYNPSQPISQTNLPPGEGYVNGQLTYTGTNTANNQVDSSGKVTQGGYLGNTYYAQGAILPPNADGSYPTLNPTSTAVQQVNDSMTKAIAQSDSDTATQVQNIQAEYNALIQQQEIVNSSQAAGANNNRLMGGVTGQGSTAQYASQSSNSVFTSVLNQGIAAIASLTAKMNDAIAAANMAEHQQDYQYQEQMNNAALDAQKEQQDAWQQIQTQIQAQAQKVADAQAQQTKDSFVADELGKGITDPNQILKDAEAVGMNKGAVTITADDISKSMSALSPDKDAIANVALEAAKAGATPAQMAAINSATSLQAAITAASAPLGQKAAQDLYVQMQTLKDQNAQVAIAQENADTNRDKLLQDNSASALSAKNALITTPSGKTYIDGTNLDSAGKAAALNAGQTVLEGSSAQAMATISNTLGQVNNLLSAFKSSGVDLSKIIPSTAGTNSSNQGATSGFLRNYAAGAATPALENFANALKGTGASGTNGIITDLEKLPGTGNLVSTLQNNIPDKGDSATVMNGKITAITSALENAENSFLANANTPTEGTTGTINGQTVTFTNGQWVTK